MTNTKDRYDGVVKTLYLLNYLQLAVQKVLSFMNLV